MLVIGRKQGQEVEIGGTVKVKVVRVDGKQVRLGIDAPRDVSIVRPEAVRRLPPKTSAAAQPLKILIVDDSPEDRETYRRLMTVGGAFRYEMEETDSGEDGLDLLRRQRPDCVLLDYMLPDLTGLEFLSELSHGALDTPAVVMLTGHGDEAIAVQAMKHGALDYLPKRDITAALLCETIQDAVRRSERTAGGPWQGLRAGHVAGRRYNRDNPSA